MMQNNQKQRDVRPKVNGAPYLTEAIGLVIEERRRQIELWRDLSGNHMFEWISILGEEYGELCEAVNETFFKNGTHPERGSYEKIIKEAVHVAAVSTAIIESALRFVPEKHRSEQEVTP